MEAEVRWLRTNFLRTFSRRCRVVKIALMGGLMLWAGPAWAGMTVYDLQDVYRLRLEDISFFAVLLFVLALVTQVLWNVTARGLPRMPRLKYRHALGLSLLLGLSTLFVLTMISGIREVLTPGAWRRQGAAYRLNSDLMEAERRRSLEQLREVLFRYAAEHEGRFPPHDFVPEIPGKLWELPDNSRTRYLYFTRAGADADGVPLAAEPPNLSDRCLVLLRDGQVEWWDAERLKALIPRAKP